MGKEKRKEKSGKFAESEEKKININEGNTRCWMA